MGLHACWCGSLTCPLCVQLAELTSAVESSDVKSPRSSAKETKAVSAAWMREFPLLPTAANLAVARAMHQQQPAQQAEQERGPAAEGDSEHALVRAWLDSMPATADPHATLLYTHHSARAR